MRLYLLKVPQPSQTTSQAGDQVFKSMSQLGSFHMQTAILPPSLSDPQPSKSYSCFTHFNINQGGPSSSIFSSWLSGFFFFYSGGYLPVLTMPHRISSYQFYVFKFLFPMPDISSHLWPQQHCQHTLPTAVNVPPSCASLSFLFHHVCVEPPPWLRWILCLPCSGRWLDHSTGSQFYVQVPLVTTARALMLQGWVPFALFWTFISYRLLKPSLFFIPTLSWWRCQPLS